MGSEEGGLLGFVFRVQVVVGCLKNVPYVRCLSGTKLRQHILTASEASSSLHQMMEKDSIH